MDRAKVVGATFVLIGVLLIIAGTLINPLGPFVGVLHGVGGGWMIYYGYQSATGSRKEKDE